MDVSEITVFGMDLPTLGSKILYLAVAVIVAYVLDKLAQRALHRALDVTEVPSASIIVNIARIGIWALALTSVLQPVFGIEPNAVVTALGVTGVAISLGVQDTVSNLIGGIVLMVGKAITIGDCITVGSTTGVVSDIDLRSTTLRERGGNVEVIPNSVLSKTSLEKLAPQNAGSCDVPIYVRPGADLDEVSRDAKAVAVVAAGDDLDPRHGVSVLFEGFDPYGTKGTVWVHVKDDVVFGAVRDRVTRALQGRSWIASALPEQPAPAVPESK